MVDLMCGIIRGTTRLIGSLLGLIVLLLVLIYLSALGYRYVTTTWVSPPTHEGLMDRQAREVFRSADTRQEKAQALIALTIPAEEPKPWVLSSQVRQGTWTMPSGGLMSGLPSGRFGTLAECQAHLHRVMEDRIQQRREQSATYPHLGLRTDVKSTPNYVGITESQRATGAQVHEAVCSLFVEIEP